MAILKSTLRSTFFLCFAIAVAWQAFYLCTGFILNNFFPHLIYATQPQDIDIFKTLPLSHHLSNWDSVWYLNIAEKLYTWNEFSAAFYPLYPMLIKSVDFITFGAVGLIGSALIINTLALALILSALLKIGVHFFGKAKYLYVLLAVFFLASPAAIFLHLVYTEALYCALSFWAYYFALKRKWISMSILLGLLTATRITALLVIGLCLLEYLRYYSWDIRKAINKNTLWFLLIPVGFLCYMLLLKLSVHDPLAMFHAYGSDSWSYHSFNVNIFQTIWNEAKDVARVMVHINSKHELQGMYFDLFIFNTLLPLVSLFVIFASSLYAIFRIKDWGIPLGVFGLVSIVMFTLNSNLVSVHRYTLPIITIYIVIFYAAQKSQTILIALLFSIPIMAALQGVLFLLFSRNIFIG